MYGRLLSSSESSIAQFGGTARRERHHLIGKMGVVVGLFVVVQVRVELR